MSTAIAGQQPSGRPGEKHLQHQTASLPCAANFPGPQRMVKNMKEYKAKPL
ncbi:hypothetical protein HMPREF9080_00465 [Cardiobacterium valvarum F0432]|uniref:Uncharacterized protein n=1 Tax=Cardiobacterium valvarum F0432 TaxID=797473 RepID=G9ZCI8_9GAMM|nr:hypothetical protein HMPREF9080_00465 [Cardiobacterium valvarum F0432]